MGGKRTRSLEGRDGEWHLAVYEADMSIMKKTL